MRVPMLTFALILAASAAQAAGPGDYYGKWSRGNCDDEWIAFSDGKVMQFNKHFEPISRKPSESPATIAMNGASLSVEMREKGRSPRRDVYAPSDKDTLTLQETFVDGRRVPPITRDAVVYKRCK